FVFVPYILIQNRYNGTVMAIGISFLIGTILLYLFTKTVQPYPEKSMVEIIEATKQKWFLYLMIPVKTVLSGLSSILVVGGYAVVVTSYLNYDSNLNMIIILLLLAIGFAATRNLLTIAYIIEFMMVISIPIILFIMIKTIMNPIFTFDPVLAVSQHY